jgi:hexosaminidase
MTDKKAGYAVRWESAGPIEEGLREIVREAPESFTETDAAVRLMFRKAEDERSGLAIHSEPDRIVVEYGRPRDAFRAVAHLLSHARSGTPVANRRESSTFEWLGVMVDASRNAVPTVETIRYLLRRFALMGVNGFMLYTEDTYEIPGEPMFGYFRGRYSAGELKEVDRYASLFGIEVIPCIQTLAHLERILQWPAYASVKDTQSVLLAEEEATYALIGRMLDAAQANVKSRRIHIGMDEAQGIGTGAYRLRNGLIPPHEIIVRHLDRVANACRERGLSPMMWSDMFFRVESSIEDYYDRNSPEPHPAKHTIPDGVDLVYWDYYHLDPAFYSEWIRRHRVLGREPVFAGGVWTWNRFWTALPHTFATLQAGMQAAADAGLREAMATIWGDDGMECDLLSALPGVQRFADLAYGVTEPSRDTLPGSCGMELDAWMEGSRIDNILGAARSEAGPPNTGKWLLWEDPVLAFLHAHVPESAESHYRNLAGSLSAIDVDGPGKGSFTFVTKLAHVLALKLEAVRRSRDAARRRDPVEAGALVKETLPDLIQQVEELWKIHRANWYSRNKPFGWEILEGRYGGLLARLHSLREILERLSADPGTPVPEFEEELLPVLPSGRSDVFSFMQARSPSR